MKPITLNEKYRIEKDSYSWVLVFAEMREKENQKTGKKENFLFEDKWYYPDLKMVLRKYINLDCKECDTLEEIVSKLDQIDETVNNLKNTVFIP